MAKALRSRRIVLLVVMLALPTALMANWWHGDKHFRGRKYKPPPPTAKITVTVMSEQFHKPVNDAHVIFHSTRDNRPDGYMEMVTNRQGKAVITVIPVGDTLVLQVIGNDYQTFGQVYKVDSKDKNITVMLLPPQGQFSAYRSKPTGQIGAGGKGTTTPQQEAKQDTSSQKQ
jgi:hypothetical protein